MAKLKLNTLSARQARFYREAQRRFRDNASWFEFEEFALGRDSPLYDGVTAKTDVLGTPLYEELKNMWLQLGVKQGMVRDDRARRS